MRHLLIPFLALAAASAARADDFAVVRCNEQVSGGRFVNSLVIQTSGGTFEYVVGEAGLTDDIAFDAEAAIAFARARHPDLTADGQGYYDNRCFADEDDD
jgi:hypothetical protein